MMILHGDCLEELGDIEPDIVQLVYLDPPFFTQRSHTLKTRDNSKMYEFSDQWASLQDYLNFMRACLTQCHRVLHPSGSIFLHCDRSASHHLRVLLDEVFGPQNFQSEIIWAYKRWSNAKKGLLNCHQNIYFYSKTDVFTFNTIYTNYSPTTNVDQILQRRKRDHNGKAVYDRDETGEVILGDEKKGVPLSDVWSIPYLNPKAKERVGYPTQKPLLLLERILKIASTEGNTVLDPFCGSGTTLVAAQTLRRDFIGIDISDAAIKVTKERLQNPIKSQSALLQKGQGAYLEKNRFEMSLLDSIDAVPVQRNKGIDGFLRQHIGGKPVSVKIQKPDESLEEAKRKLLAASRTKQCVLKILVRTNRISEHSFLPDLAMEDDDLLVIDAYSLPISDWLDLKSKALKSFDP